MPKNNDPGTANGGIRAIDSNGAVQGVPGFNFLGGTAPRPVNKGGASVGGYRDNNSSPAGHTERPSPNTVGPRGSKGNSGNTKRA